MRNLKADTLVVVNLTDEPQVSLRKGDGTRASRIRSCPTRKRGARRN
jgi:hypothetical protein